MTTAPSGEQFELRHADQAATVVAVGGGVRTYHVGDRAVIDGYDETAQCDGGRGQTLAPWPNRVRDGQWRYRGRDLQLPLTEPAARNAIHGLVRWVPWTAESRSEAAVTLMVTSYPQPGYPWTISVRNAWSLDAHGLAVTTTIRNRSDSVAPVAAGFHPYVTVGGGLADHALLTVPADTWLTTDDRQVPTGSEPVAGTSYDFRVARAIGEQRIDHAFTDLQRDADGRCRVRLADPRGTDAVTVWVDEAYSYLEIFTGDTLPDPARRRQGVAVEPMSAPPNAFATGESLVELEPGGHWEGRWGITAS